MKTDSKEASYDASYKAPLTRKIGLKAIEIGIILLIYQGAPNHKIIPVTTALLVDVQRLNTR